MNEQNEEILLDLLSKKAVYGLTEEEQRQLDSLDNIEWDWEDDDSFELSAAAINLTDIKVDEPLPTHLQSKILANADAYFAEKNEKSNVLKFGKGAENVAAQVGRQIIETQPRASLLTWLGWAFAAAACVALAVNIWTTRLQTNSPDIVQNPPQTTQTPKTLTLAEQREQLLASANDLAKTTWTDFDPKKPQNVKGDVVWSNSQQKGFVRFQNIPANDKSRETYQIWIFDDNQKNPVSGGVFDANETGEIIIPIEADLTIQKPKMVGVTAEKPGGVVVSELKKVMAVAKFET